MEVGLVDTPQAGNNILQSVIFPETDAVVYSDKVTFAVHSLCAAVCVNRASPIRSPLSEHGY